MFAKCIVGHTKKVKTFFQKSFSKIYFPLSPLFSILRGKRGSEAYNLHISFLITFVYFKFLILPTLLNSLGTTAIKERTTALKKKTFINFEPGHSWIKTFTVMF